LWDLSNFSAELLLRMGLLSLALALSIAAVYSARAHDCSNMSIH
jgi:hypothetical protein